jgi:plastocyanin
VPAVAQQPAPTPEPNAAVTIAPRPCALETDDTYEKKMYELEGWDAPSYERYPGKCQRMRFAYGPIHVKPGQNDVLVEPVTIQKPLQDGYITRFKPNLVLPDGTVPPVEQVHLHHGTWLSQPEYGSGPFFAAGEEKTIAPFPRGFGMPVKGSDTWLLLYMVHSAVQQPMEVFITYDVDFVTQAAGDELGMKPAYPVWLDVRPSGYPVFNVQRQYGGMDGVCQWPREECAAHDPFGQEFTGQGKPGNGQGQDFELPKEGAEFGRSGPFKGGTLIGIGGHLHPGGLTNDIDLVRPGGEDVTTVKRSRKCKRVKTRKRTRSGKRKYKKKCRIVRRKVTVRKDTTRIYTGEAVYWNPADKSKGGGPPTSWDFSMRVTGLPYWGVHLKPGDKLRSNATYETTIQSSYENMGIAVSLFVPNDENGKPQAPGVNPFQAPLDSSEGCRSGGIRAKKPRVCDRGLPTHGHYKENGNHSGPSGTWNAQTGSPTNEVGVVNFQFLPGDLSLVSMTGVPTVKLGQKLRFTNLEGGAIYHTATSCAFPCLGPTGAAFPLADGQASTGRPLDFDSSEMGVGVPAIGAAKQDLTYELPVTEDRGFKPGETVTYFCRVHPGMRGAFEVTE